MSISKPPSLASRSRIAVAGAAILLLTLTACGSDEADDQETDEATAAGGGASEVTGDIAVFAAASLTDTFTELGEQFEAAHPGTTVTFNFAGSSTLAQQIIGGAPVDVFAAASPATMAQVTDEGLAEGEPTVFVRNRLEIAVPAGNPAGVSGLEDFTDEDLIIALCAEEVPCGAASVRVFEAAGLTPAPDTYEQDVRATLTKVELGEVDAALVYRTDVMVAGDSVEGIEFPESDGAVNDYPLVALAEAPNADGAQAFIDFVLGDAGREALGAAGFDLP
ncbi:molybdate ABC transporter substrate-binding protein [Ornithinimicrobium sp. F0845]|uniref:molybdate ABC transporter substrate-binding protein n=1 Tax=Ornithinimicrobium sp. F0845 TaxID=2926412 RepID=UPI001FF20954|nr:molybdate ABC transporter substrate-binding protein [Ornithinimicrobium sp. F0845]MCK0110821.1 molybdate ABC transporter substrate-binding protein [Ornithinimicrobium sp. F0845]